MPLPQRRSDEQKPAFIDRCMGNPTMVGEFPDVSQRRAVCERQALAKTPIGNGGMPILRRFNMRIRRQQAETIASYPIDEFLKQAAPKMKLTTGLKGTRIGVTWIQNGTATFASINTPYCTMNNDPATVAMFAHVKQSRTELDELFAKSRGAFTVQLLDVARAVLKRDDTSDAVARLAKVLTPTLIFSDLLGRRRLLLELDASGSFAVVPVVRMPEAIQTIIEREPRLAASALEVARVYAENGFALAKSAAIEVTKRVQKLLAKGLGENLTLSLQRLTGWTRAYSETVYRTNINSAYTAGRFRQAQDPDVAKVIGAFERVSAQDPDVRENHQAAHGLIAAPDDDVWNWAATPSGYNCRCTLRFVPRAELAQRGLIGKGGRVLMRTPANFSSYHPDRGFSVVRPDRRFYGN